MGRERCTSARKWRILAKSKTRKHCALRTRWIKPTENMDWSKTSGVGVPAPASSDTVMGKRRSRLRERRFGREKTKGARL